MKAVCKILKEAAVLWYNQDADFMAATVSYYVLFALAPLLFLSVSLIGLVYGRDLVADTFLTWGSVLGPDITELLTKAVANLESLSTDFYIPLLGALFFSGMTVVMFNSFTYGMHRLWGIKNQGLRGWLRKCWNSVVFIAVFELYLLITVGAYQLTGLLLSLNIGWLGYLFSVVSTILLTTILFVLMFRILTWWCPPRRALLLGAFVASVLLYIAQSLVAIYVATTPVPGLYGAAGLLLALLIWIYVSVAIVYYGAAVAYVAGKRGQIEGV